MISMKFLPVLDVRVETQKYFANLDIICIPQNARRRANDGTLKDVLPRCADSLTFHPLDTLHVELFGE